MRVIATTLIKHNGNYFQIGQEVPGLTESEIAKLVASNSATVEDGNIAPEPPVNALDVPEDSVSAQKGVSEVANMPIAITMKKTQLIGVARANGLKVEQTATPAEVYKMIKDYREKEGITVEDVKPAKKVTAKNPHAPKKEDVEVADKMDDKEDEDDEGKEKVTPPGADSKDEATPKETPEAK